MLDKLERSELLSLHEEPLPRAWLRARPTEPDGDGDHDGIVRVGSAGKLHRAIVDTLDRAKEVALVASFLLADEDVCSAMVRAAERGVRVYALTASETKLASLPKDDDEFEARMIEEHKQLLNRLAGKVLVRTASHFHAKFVVADPSTAPAGYLSTANFNLALRRSVELGVRLTAEEAREVAAWFAWAFWAEAEHELVGKGRLAAVAAAPALPERPAGRSVLATSKVGTMLHDEALRIVRGARQTLDVASYGLDLDHPVVQAVLDKAKSGVRVRVFTRTRPAVARAVEALVAAGAVVIAHDRLHAKAVVSEAGALVLSANLEPHGLDDGFEVGVRLDGARARALVGVLDEWADRFPWRVRHGARRRDHLGELLPLDKGPKDGILEVVAEVDVPLPEMVATDAADMASTRPPDLVPPRDPKRLPRQARFRWVVKAPRLPKAAKQRFQVQVVEETDKKGNVGKREVQVPFSPPVYEDRGRVMVVCADAQAWDSAVTRARELGAVVVLP